MKKYIILAVVAAVVVIAGIAIDAAWQTVDDSPLSYIQKAWFSGNAVMSVCLIILWVMMYTALYFVLYKKELGYFIAALFLAGFVGAAIRGFADHNYKAQEVVKDVVQETEATTFNINMPWLGQPVRATLSRVQKERGRLMNMVSIQYENGVVLAPEGVVDTTLVFAYLDAVAPEGVERCFKKASSAIWNGEKWVPAMVNEINGLWVYSALHHKDDRLIINPREINPIPGSQSYWVNDHRIKFFYVRPNDTKRTVFQLNIVS